ncbi:50S ribosomal protein L15 [bacterium]|nr:50S ribosomal protein L15 [bacterium]
MNLNELKPARGSKQKRKRVGRGPGSGRGLHCGRGNKGQNSRSGGGVRVGFEGGQMPLTRRLPKRGFKNAPFKKEYTIINVSELDRRFKEGTEVTVQILKEMKLTKKDFSVKILGGGEIKKSLQVKVNAFSESARQKIEAAGGKIQIV